MPPQSALFPASACSHSFILSPHSPFLPFPLRMFFHNFVVYGTSVIFHAPLLFCQGFLLLHMNISSSVLTFRPDTHILESLHTLCSTLVHGIGDFSLWSRLLSTGCKTAVRPLNMNFHMFVTSHLISGWWTSAQLQTRPQSFRWKGTVLGAPHHEIICLMQLSENECSSKASLAHPCCHVPFC